MVHPAQIMVTSYWGMGVERGCNNILLELNNMGIRYEDSVLLDVYCTMGAKSDAQSRTAECIRFGLQSAINI